MHVYSKVERERRFLLGCFPPQVNAARVRQITDRYLDGTRLRLREETDDGGSTVFKLTQKIPSPGSGAQQGFITSMYVNATEFRVLSELPGRELKKTRFSVPPFGIDVFRGGLEGLVLAEAEFESAADAEALMTPSFAVAEVSDDDRFTGGRLARAARHEIEKWLLEYRVQIR